MSKAYVVTDESEGVCIGLRAPDNLRARLYAVDHLWSDRTAVFDGTLRASRIPDMDDTPTNKNGLIDDLEMLKAGHYGYLDPGCGHTLSYDDDHIYFSNGDKEYHVPVDEFASIDMCCNPKPEWEFAQPQPQPTLSAATDSGEGAG